MASEKQNKQRGASMLEYALVVALISLIAVAGVSRFGVTLGASFDNTKTQLETASGNLCDPSSPNYDAAHPSCQGGSPW